MIAETMRVHSEAEAHRQLKQNGWTLTTFGGRTFNRRARRRPAGGTTITRRAAPPGLRSLEDVTRASDLV